jgi:hypothetical protein
MEAPKRKDLNGLLELKRFEVKKIQAFRGWALRNGRAVSSLLLMISSE